ncbi:unnamed protein product, partial [Iphiclides podalirius]
MLYPAATTRSVPSTTVATITRRPFRIASRRRPVATTKTTSTTTTTTTQPTTEFVESEEFLKDIEENGSIEDPSYAPRSSPKDNSKVQRRPLVSLKDEQDQNIAATNEEEKKRQSKKYSSTFKQNQLDEALRLKTQDAYDVDVDPTTEGKFTIEGYSAETAVALAAHKLLEAPVPIIPDYEYDAKPTRSAPSRSTQKFKYTDTDYPREVTKTPSYPVAYSATPSYSTRDYVQTSTGGYPSNLIDTVLPSTIGFRTSKPAGFTAPTIINPGLSGVSRDLGPSTVRYLSTTDENVATHNINPTDNRYTDSSEYSKAPPSTIQYVSTVDKYSGVSYDLTPTNRYVDTSETTQTLSPTTRTRGRRPTTTESNLNEYTSSTLSSSDILVDTSKKYSEISRSTGPSTTRYLDSNNGFTGILQNPSVTNKYIDSGDETKTYQTPGPSTEEYLDNRYTETAQNLNPTNRFTVTSERYTEEPLGTNPSTASYFTEGSKYTRIPQEEIPTSTFSGTAEIYSEPANTRAPANIFTDRGESYTTLQNARTTNKYTDANDKYTSISRRRKPSTTTVIESEKYTTGAVQNTSPTVDYTANERYTEASRRRRPSTNFYTETTTERVIPTESTPSTTERTIPSRRRRPSTNTYTSTEYTTESTPDYGFTATSETYPPRRRARPSTSRYDDATGGETSEISQAGPTTGFTGVNEPFVETSPTLRSSTVRNIGYTESDDKSTETPQLIETYTTGRKYADISRARNPSTSTYLESTEKQLVLADDEVTTDRYLNQNGQYTGIVRDLSPSTVKYLSTEDRSTSESPSIKFPSTTGKYVSGPIDDYSFSTTGYSQSQEPSYFTREYLLASPVTKTYDDEYQYLSPVTSTQPTSTTRKLARKKMVFRRISTTAQASSTTTTTTPTPRRSSRKPFEKIRKVQKVKVQKGSKKTTQLEEEKEVKQEQPETKVQLTQRQPVQRVKPVKKVQTSETNKVIRPIDAFDYYDDSQEKVVQKYEEGTKVILHGKGRIECLDIGNFPHPSSCKKFISCARMEGGSLLGWEYVCPKGLSFDPVGGICNWSAGLGCQEQDS